MQNQDVIPISEAIATYSRSRTTLKRWIREGRLTKFSDRSRRIYLSRAELDRETTLAAVERAS